MNHLIISKDDLEHGIRSRNILHLLDPILLHILFNLSLRPCHLLSKHRINRQQKFLIPVSFIKASLVLLNLRQHRINLRIQLLHRLLPRRPLRLLETLPVFLYLFRLVIIYNEFHELEFIVV